MIRHDYHCHHVRAAIAAETNGDAMRMIDPLRRVGALLLCGALLLATAQTVAAQGRRVALVIGNGGYVAAPYLANPANDARLLAQTLGSLGFTLIGGGALVDLGKPAFDAAVGAFGQALPGAEVALFYYAGHGMQIQGTNWLVPRDASPLRLQDLEAQMIDASLVLRHMEAGKAKLNVLILDACRDNPFAGLGPGRGETGLAQMLPAQAHGRRATRGDEPGLAQMRAPEGTVIAFATQPGNTARDGSGANSPYTLALADAMRQRGLNVLSMFNRVGVAVKRSTAGAQQPWVSNSPIEGEYFFAGPGSGTVTLVSNSIPAAIVALANRQPEGLPRRIAMKAGMNNIPVPSSMNVDIPRPDVPPEVSRFAGAWGPGVWLGEGETHFILVIDHVDAKGNAHLVRLSSGECDNVECSKRSPRIIPASGRIENGVLSFTEKSGWRFMFEIGLAGWLHGTNGQSNSLKHSSSPLSRIE
jgi:uncharacterized caspase-like protein